MNISSDTIVGEVVKHNFKTALLFQSYNIDYCCNGNRSIEKAAADAGIDASVLVNQINAAIVQPDPDANYINGLSLTELSNYIIKRHHEYVKHTIPYLKQNVDKIAMVHGANHPELKEVMQLFSETAGELTAHMQKEEIMLFPHIQKLEGTKSIGNSPFGSVANPISAMMADHQNEGDRFAKINHLTKSYSIPADACTTYTVTLNQLKEFEDDLHRHIHLENNILFPKAIELEKSFSGN